MSIVEVVLMGTPTVKIDGEVVHFPYHKAAGFFYYLCVRKKVSREEAASIFWGNSDEKISRKNLRDVIYKIKKIFGEDILHLEGNTSIQLNTSYDVEIDVNDITEDSIISLYKGSFLDHFYIKNCSEFENWCENVRTYFREMYIAQLYKQLYTAKENKDITTIKECAAILIQNDIYDEEMYRNIIRTYSESGHYNLAIKTYYELKEVLHEDLGETPAQETKVLFQNILKLKESSGKKESIQSEYFYGRFKEVFETTECLNRFVNGSSKSLFISGEAGVGKTAFLTKIKKLIDDSCVVLHYNCHYPERDFYFKVWYSLLEQIEVLLQENPKNGSLQQIFLNEYWEKSDHDKSVLASDLKTGNITNIQALSVGNSLFRLTERQKVVLVIDDIQWIDVASLKILCSFILELKGKRFITIATHRDDYPKSLKDLMVSLERENAIIKIDLERFSYNETKEIVEQTAPNLGNDSYIINKIYQETDGNALFLTELVKAVEINSAHCDFLSPKSANVIASRLIDLIPEENEVINAVSLFHGGACMDDLKIFLPMVELEIFEIIESLMSKKLIGEKVMNGDVFFILNHQKFEEYIHNRQSTGKLMVLHKKIAEKYEKDFMKNPKMYLYPKLIYHFGECRDKYKTYFYKIEYLKEYYYIFQETFPHLRVLDIDEEQQEYQNIDFDEKNLIQLAEEVATSSDGSQHYLFLQMQIYFVMGRYYIYEGNYQKGLASIDESSRLAKRLNDYEYLFGNYKQYIHYSIQVSDFNSMKKYLDKCIQIIKKLKQPEKEDHILSRLNGLYLLETGQYKEAQAILLNTIDRLETNQDFRKNSMDLAVCYNYLGRNFSCENLWEEALEYFLKAIEICNKSVVTNGIGIFYSNAAQAFYELGRYLEAQKYNKVAIDFFEKTHALWGRAKAEIYASLIEFQLGNSKKFQFYFDKAKITNAKMNNSQHLQLIQEISNYIDHSCN